MSDLIRLAPGLALDADYVAGGTFALLGKKGAGKSFTTRVLAEEFWRAGVQFVLIDPMGANWGLRSSADGKGEGLPIPIFGGEHADAPLERTAGKLMADLIVQDRLSMILDLSEFGSHAAERQFVLDLLERVYRTNKELVHILLDESDLYAPQKPAPGDQAVKGVVDNVVRRGRNRAIAITLITQRSAVLDKDVLTQVDGVILLRLTGPQDRDAAMRWVEDHGEPEQNAMVRASLPELANGEAWIWIPELHVFERVQIRMSRTFDSSPTRTRKGRGPAPKGYADVDLSAIGEKIAATVERAKQEDPGELRKQLAQLRRELAKRSTETKIETVTETVEVEVPVVPIEVDAAVSKAGLAINEAVEAIRNFEKDASRRTPAPKPVQRPAPAPVRSAPSAPPRPARHASSNGDVGDVTLKAGARRMLAALASLHPAWLTRPQIGTLAKVKHTGGTFGDYLSALRTSGAIEESGSGRSAEYRITDRGFELLGSEAPAPATPDELLDMWRDRLKRGAREMLDELVRRYPEWLTREELAAAPENPLAVSGGTFGDYLSMLRRAGLIDEDKSKNVRASETLFLGSAA